VQPESIAAGALAEQARLLGHAAAGGDVATVRSILKAHPRVVQARGGIMRSTPLHFAADRGFVEIALLLLEAGADINARERASGTTPLHWAAVSGHLDMVRLLTGYRADIEARDDWHRLGPLGWAATVAQTPRLAVVGYLLSQGAKMDIFSAVALGREDEVRALARHRPASLRLRMNWIEDARGPLHHAALNNMPEMVEALLRCGAEIDGKTTWGLTPLCLAHRANAAVVVDVLGRRGAETELSALIGTGQLVRALAVLQHKRSRGSYRLLLHFTARENLSQAAALLLIHGADPNAFGSQIVDERVCRVTPLHRAATLGQMETARVLLAHGADPNRPSRGYWRVTALHLAAWRGHAEVARLLLESGADPSLRERHGGTALDWAVAHDQTSVASLLQPPMIDH
jgi:ankyrin repeat protein